MWEIGDNANQLPPYTLHTRINIHFPFAERLNYFADNSTNTVVPPLVLSDTCTHMHMG